MKRVLITGGAGFVGYHLARELLRIGGHEITLVDNFRRGRRDRDFDALLREPGVRLVEADLAIAGGMSACGTGFDEVYHLAAVIGVRNVIERPHDVIRINALATIHLLEWFIAGGGKRFLFASTSEAYAWTQHFHALPIPTGEDVPLALTDLRNPRSSYAGSKIFGELAVTHMCGQAGLPYSIVRFHNVYGPRMGYEHVIPELYERVRNGETPLTVYAAEHRRAFCYIADAVALVLLAMRSSVGTNHTFNVGNDSEELSMRELAERVQEIAGVKRPITAKPAAHDPIKRRCPDISKARELLGYEPRWNLVEGLERTLAWYASNPRPETA